MDDDDEVKEEEEEEEEEDTQTSRSFARKGPSSTRLNASLLHFLVIPMRSWSHSSVTLSRRDDEEDIFFFLSKKKYLETKPPFDLLPLSLSPHPRGKRKGKKTRASARSFG